jgi:hypothetical protein
MITYFCVRLYILYRYVSVFSFQFPPERLLHQGSEQVLYLLLL